MTTIALPADIEGPLAEEARRLGITPERLALDTLRQRFTPPVQAISEKPPEPNLADFLAGYVGLVEGSTEPLSERRAESAPSDDLDDWYRELQELGPAQYEAGEWERVQATLSEADELAKAVVRRQMGRS